VGDLKKKDKTPQVLFIGDFFLLFDGNFLQPKGKRENERTCKGVYTQSPQKLDFFFFLFLSPWMGEKRKDDVYMVTEL
jgi:hypothetical protein